MTEINTNSSVYNALSGDMLLQKAKNDIQEIKKQVGNKELTGQDAKLLAVKSKNNKTAGKQQTIKNFEMLCSKASDGNAGIAEALKKTLQTSIGMKIYSGQQGLSLDKADKVMDNLIMAYRGMKALNSSINPSDLQPSNPQPMARHKDQVVILIGQSSSAQSQQSQNDALFNQAVDYPLPPPPEVDGNGSNNDLDLANYTLPPQPKVNEAAWKAQPNPPVNFDLANAKLPPQPKIDESKFSGTQGWSDDWSDIDEDEDKLHDLKNADSDVPELVDVEHLKQMKTDAKTLSKLENTENVDYNKRPQLMVAMGQGAVGPLNQLQFYTDSCSSCSPLVFYNSDTGIGGLFHVPAPGIDNWKDDKNNKNPDDEVIVNHADGVRQALRDFIELVKPDQMVLYPGQSGANKDPAVKDGLPSAETTRFLSNDIKDLLDEMGVDCKFDYRANKPRDALMVTANANGQGLKISKSTAVSINDIDLMNSDGVLPDELQDKAVVRSHLEDKSGDVLLGGSKFMKNAKLNRPQEKLIAESEDISKMVKDARDTIDEVERSPKYLVGDNFAVMGPKIQRLEEAYKSLAPYENANVGTELPEKILKEYNEAAKPVFEFYQKLQKN